MRLICLARLDWKWLKYPHRARSIVPQEKADARQGIKLARCRCIFGRFFIWSVVAVGIVLYRWFVSRLAQTSENNSFRTLA